MTPTDLIQPDTPSPSDVPDWSVLVRAMAEAVSSATDTLQETS